MVGKNQIKGFDRTNQDPVSISLLKKKSDEKRTGTVLIINHNINHYLEIPNNMITNVNLIEDIFSNDV